jgi:hypothetical protein
MHVGYWWECQKGRDHCEDKDVDGWTILKLILDRMGWRGLDRSGSEYGPVEGSCEGCNEPSGSINAGKFLSSCTIDSFSRRAQLLE